MTKCSSPSFLLLAALTSLYAQTASATTMYVTIAGASCSKNSIALTDMSCGMEGEDPCVLGGYSSSSSYGEQGSGDEYEPETLSISGEYMTSYKSLGYVNDVKICGALTLGTHTMTNYCSEVDLCEYMECGEEDKLSKGGTYEFETPEDFTFFSGVGSSYMGGSSMKSFKYVVTVSHSGATLETCTLHGTAYTESGYSYAAGAAAASVLVTAVAAAAALRRRRKRVIVTLDGDAADVITMNRHDNDGSDNGNTGTGDFVELSSIHKQGVAV